MSGQVAERLFELLPRHMPSPASRRRFALIVSLLILAAAFGFVFCSVATYPDEDAYITYVFSKNLANGNGPTYNGLKVEGYTNLGMMLAAAGASKLTGLTAAGAGFLLSALFSLLTLMVGFLLLQRAFEKTLSLAHSCALALTIVLVGLLFSPFVMYWGLSGMESGLFAFALCAAVYFVDTSQPVLALSAISLLPVIRYDGFPIMVVALVFMVMFTPGMSIRRAAMAFIPWAGAMVFRLTYYGASFPHTAYVKFFNRIPGERTREGLYYTWNALWGSKAIFLLAAILLLALLRRLQWRKTSVLLLGLAVAGFCQTVFVGGDVAWKPWGRFTHWQVVAATLAFFLLLRPEWLRWSWLAVAALGVGIVYAQPVEVTSTGMFCGSASAEYQWAPNYIFSKCFLEDPLEVRLRRTGDLARRGFDEDALVISGKLVKAIAKDGENLITSSAGRVAYHSGLPTLDITQLAAIDDWSKMSLETQLAKARHASFVVVHQYDYWMGKFMLQSGLKLVAMVSSEKNWGVHWLVYVYASRDVVLPPEVGTKESYVPVFPVIDGKPIPVYADYSLTPENSAKIEKSLHKFLYEGF
jgi:hypothetical protein